MIAAPCALCAGACCETFVVPLPVNPPPDAIRWLGMRGEIRNQTLRINVACCNLTDDGECGVWETRPQGCRDYKIGSPACREAVLRLRSTTAQAILDSIEAWVDGATDSSSSSP